MKKVFTFAVAALMSVSLLGAGTANATPLKASANATKHAKHAKHSTKKLFGSAIVCDGNGTATYTTYYFGIPFSNGGVPNSNLCN